MATGDSNVLSHSDVTARITFGVDGRVYFHELTSELLEVLAVVYPHSAEVAVRREASSVVQRVKHEQQHTHGTQETACQSGHRGA